MGSKNMAMIYNGVERIARRLKYYGFSKIK